jgi:protein tyrosine/serine phosphatase
MGQVIRDEVIEELLQGYSSPQDLLGEEGLFKELTVIDGALYRSGQLNQTQLADVIRRHGIRSILNLRGSHPADSWYTGEIAVSKELGVAHFDYPISARRRVTVEQIADLLSIIRAAPKPLLVHCGSGADRSGFVAALYLLDVEHADPIEADGQLSLFYGHFPYLLSKTGAMDESFWDFARFPRRPIPFPR